MSARLNLARLILAATCAACQGGVAPSTTTATPPAASAPPAAGTAHPGTSPAPQSTITAGPSPSSNTAMLGGPDYRIDTVAHYFVHFTARKCGGWSGIWNLTVDGTRVFDGGQLVVTGTGTITIDAATHSGTFVADYLIKITGVALGGGGQQAGVSGDVDLDKSAFWVFNQKPVGEFWGEAPGYVTGGSLDQLTDFELPITSGRFC